MGDVRDGIAKNLGKFFSRYRTGQNAHPKKV